MMTEPEIKKWIKDLELELSDYVKVGNENLVIFKSNPLAKVILSLPTAKNIFVRTIKIKVLKQVLTGIIYEDKKTTKKLHPGRNQKR